MEFSYGAAPHCVPYWINFRYDRKPPPNSSVEVRSVRCVIATDSGGLSFGRSWCHQNDQFSKETGRKLALARALKEFDRGFRTVAWKAYLGRKGEQV